MNIVLASNSPRRQSLLKLIYPDFTVVDSGVKERIDRSLPPWKLCVSLAEQKSRAVVLQHPDSIIIGADTVVSSHDKILGKPSNEKEAFEMLKFLSNDTHSVYTGVSIIYGNYDEQFHVETKVWFGDLSEKEIKEYIATGEPMDKAGAYAIQGLGAKFVKKIEGDFFNVVGLPVYTLYNKIVELEQRKYLQNNMRGFRK